MFLTQDGGAVYYSMQSVCKCAVQAECHLQLLEDWGRGDITVLECEAALEPLDAVRVALAGLDGVQGMVAVIPANMPLLGTPDTLKSVEAMLLCAETNSQACHLLSERQARQ